jgi:hypothetical protein
VKVWSDSKLLSGFPFISHGNPNNNLKSLCIRKFTLPSLVEKTHSGVKVYHSNVLFETHGHTVIQLPPYMCDLNPTELV